MPFAIRAMLHERVGGYIEETEADAIDLQLDLLAHHYWHSENLEKKREYLVRAGEAAEATYANAAAIDYLERAAPLVGEEERVDLLLKLGKVVELVGDWRRAEQVEREALAIAEMLGDAARARLVRDGARRGGAEAGSLRRGARAARRRRPGLRVGRGRRRRRPGAPPRWARSRAQQGEYPQAVASYEASLAIRERLDDKAGMAGAALEPRRRRRVRRRLRALARRTTSARSRCGRSSTTAGRSRSR